MCLTGFMFTILIIIMMANVLMAIITTHLKVKVLTVPTDLENTNVNVVKVIRNG